MRIRTCLSPWTAALFTALGLSPVAACGGTVVGRSDGTDNGVGGGGGSGGKTLPDTGGGAGGWVGTGNGGFHSDGATGWVTGGSSGTGGWETGGYISSGGGKGSALIACSNPTPHLGPGGVLTGFVDCFGGSIHRAEKRDCSSIVPRAEVCPGAAPLVDGGPPPYGCRTDADCAGQPHGYCTGAGGGRAPGCYCATGCVTDAECATGQICLCGDPVGQCVPASCTTKGDCAGAALCLSYTFNPGCGGTAFACQTYGDECASASNCDTGSLCGLVDGAHRCVRPMCAEGRPFLVGGAARVASVSRRRDWSSSLAPRLDGLDRAARDLLAARWTEAALMEHASIAAFARFALEIMSFGAPPELIVGAHAAMADETEHARDAFALASAYAGKPVGPGKLDVGAALSSHSPLDVVRTTILEGCIGETVAAVEAAEALAHATDPAVREALGRVTVDETRHAELAWRFVQWVLNHGDAALRAAAAIELVGIIETEAARHHSDRAQPRNSEPTLLAHGLVGDETRSEIRQRVLEEIVLPCARALVRASAPRQAVSLAELTSRYPAS